MDFGLHFAPSGNVTAATIGAPPPDCGPAAQAVLGPDGSWVCEPIPDTHGELGRTLMWIVAGYVLFNVYTKRWKGIYHKVKQGDVGAIL